MVSINGIMNTAKSVYRYGKRVAESTPELIFGTGSEAAGKAMRNASGTLFDKARAGWNAAEKAGKGSFFKSLGKNFMSFIPDMKTYVKAGIKLAEKQGKSTFWGVRKGLFKGLGKKLPFIGSVLLIAGELPNVVKAVKEKGLWQGIKEVGKSGAKLAGGAAGAAIGSAICPGIGSLIGWIAGEWLTGKIVGKSYSEEKAEKEEQRQQLIDELQQQGMLVQNPQVNPQVNPQTIGLNPFDPTQIQTNPSSFDNFGFDPRKNLDEFLNPSSSFDMVV